MYLYSTPIYTRMHTVCVKHDETHDMINIGYILKMYMIGYSLVSAKFLLINTADYRMPD